MGTRNLTMVLADNEIKVAQYGQWDGYFSGQGNTILSFIKRTDMSSFKEKVKECKFKEAKDIWNDLNLSSSFEKATNDDYEIFMKKNPSWDRDTGSEILNLINEDTVRYLQNSYDFGYDSLYCEYAYLINLDNETLEVYTGFTKRKLNKKERFYEDTKSKAGYYGVSLFHIVPFKDIKEKESEEIVKMLEDLE